MSDKNRFFICFVASAIALSAMLFLKSGYNIILLALASVVMVVGVKPFIHTAWSALKQHHANMDTLVALGTTTAYIYSVFAMIFRGPIFFDATIYVTTFVLLGQVMEESMRRQTSGAIEKLLHLQAESADVYRDESYQTIPLEKVIVGDRIRVKPGQKIPTDGTIISGSTSIDESAMTGESIPVQKSVGEHVFGATINTSNLIEIKATQVGANTALANIVSIVKKAQASRAPIQKTADAVSNIFVPVIAIIAVVTFIFWVTILSAPLSTALMYAVSVIVIACPCALGLATPTALMVGVGLGAKQGILIKGGGTLEAAKNINTVMFDKTGTITNGKPIVTDVVSDDAKRTISIASSIESTSTHPLATAIVDYAKKHSVSPIDVHDVKNIEGKGILAKDGSDVVFIGSSSIVANMSISQTLQDKAKALQKQAKTISFVGRNGTAIGIIAIQDTTKPSAKTAIQQLKKQSITTIMLTGDNQQVADEIARQTGIDQVIAGVLPAEKADHVKSFMQQHHVAFVGDGINDAPALASAELGIAMGSGTDIAIESGDIILLRNDLTDVVRALNLSKRIYRRIKLNLIFSFIYNIIGIPIAAGVFAGIGVTLSPELSGLAMALSSVSVVASSLALNLSKSTKRSSDVV